MSNYDMLKIATEGLSGGKNTIVLDDKGMPSFMVRIPKFKISDVIDGGTQDIHHAFIVDGVEKDMILISKYQNIVKNDRAYSLPLMDPRTSVTFDQAKLFSENKGPGFHLMTNAERAALALWCKKNGTMPRGNNNYGSDVSAPHEKGIETLFSSGKTARVATGSGPASWAHDGTTDGIYDLNGNVNEWIGGLRLMDGEIQIIPYNNAAAQVNQSAVSTLWKAIMPDGSLVEPGTIGTLKYDAEAATPTGIRVNTSIVNPTGGEASVSKTFQTVAAAAEVDIPQILKSLALFPQDNSDHGGDYLYMRNEGERLPCFGGNWRNAARAGVFNLGLNGPRSNSDDSLGFRSAYIL